MPRADMDELMNLKVKFPEKEERKEIIAKIRCYSDEIAKTKLVIEMEFEAMLQLSKSILNEALGEYTVHEAKK